MNGYLALIGAVIVICVLLNRFAQKLPVPSLLIFIGLGMCFGVNGILGIPFDDYQISEQICSVCLLFVMFYGGFGTNLKAARPVAAKAVLLSTAGVALTAGFVGLFVRFVLGLEWLESFLIGSVIASTDAASVFNILKTQKQDLKDNTASLLELESGSNDPFSLYADRSFCVNDERRNRLSSPAAGRTDSDRSPVWPGNRASGCISAGKM